VRAKYFSQNFSPLLKNSCVRHWYYIGLLIAMGVHRMLSWVGNANILLILFRLLMDAHKTIVPFFTTDNFFPRYQQSLSRCTTKDLCVLGAQPRGETGQFLPLRKDQVVAICCVQQLHVAIWQSTFHLLP